MAQRFPVEILPILGAVFMFIGLATTYGIAAGLKHTDAFAPYISNTGDKSPENGIFTIVMSGTTFLLVAIMLIRFKQVWDGTYHTGIKKIIIQIVNCVALPSGLISGIGTLLVGSYRMSENNALHNDGVVIGLLFGFIYMVLHTAIGPFVRPRLKLRWLVLGIRIILLILIVVASGIFLGCKEYDYYVLLKISAITEWFLYALIQSFFFIFVVEFRKMNLIFHFEFQENIRDDFERVWSDDKEENSLSIKLLPNC
ncbi:DNA damage-regulated autophagy modulator protein 2 [Oopsacas minuta]|uniref:DNA damage-regulated autophagy modulator protein 2 n=1 Tax=Oopsacas minuta TaxID=111878 RepID=A0AAV7KJI9_9METZ|nr:DNA damage-regulated autophagy modulator protein 2 [Oopsacas minuta]